MKAWFVLLAVLFATSGLPAQVPAAAAADDLQQQIKDLQERIITLEGQVRILKQAQAPAAAAGVQPSPAAAGETPQATAQVAAPSVAAPQTQTVQLGGAGGLAKALNPDISVIGDFLGSVGGNSSPFLAQQEPFRSLEMHESEVGLQAIIDPYARGDFFLTFGEQGVGLEEGYITFTALPAGLVGRVGKMRAAFGKVNTMHNHVLPWTDRPLVTDNLVGGEDGINDAGISVTRIIPAPKGLFLEGTAQVFRGDSGDDRHPLFVAARKNDVSTVAHLRGYRDITESTNLDIGLSFARGHNDGGGVPGFSARDFVGRDFVTHLYGVDATLRWKPLRRSIYHSFVGRTEFVWSQRQQVPATVSALDLSAMSSTALAAFRPAMARSFGYYASADYQLGRRWFIGGRWDWSERARLALADRGASLVLSYWPSEFSQLRGQYRFTHYGEGLDANEILMQVQFILGAHGAHPF